MTTKFIEAGGDATGGFEFYSSTSGTISVDATVAHTGGSSIKFTTGAGPTSGDMKRSGVLADAGRRISFWFRFDTLPSSIASMFVCRKSDGTTNVLDLQLQANGGITLIATGAQTITGTTLLVVNTWYQLTLSYYITNTTTYTAKLYINGVLENTASTGTLTNTGTDTIQFRCNSGWGTNRAIWYDDVYVDDGASSSSQTDTGAIRVTVKRPFSNGTANNFTTQVGSGSSGYGSGHAPQVNERPLSQTNGWSVVAAAATTEEYNIEGIAIGDLNIGGHRIVDVCGWVFAKALLSETAQIIINNATSNISLTSTAALFQAFAGSTTYPAGTGTDIGVVTAATATTVTLYECGIMIAYIPQVIPKSIFPRRTA